MDIMDAFKREGCVIAIGHSDATYEQALESFRRGVSLATHLFNAMREYRYRQPGVVGAVLDSRDVMAEIIADGIHIHPQAVRLAVTQKEKDKICLVTDSMNASGLGDGIYRVGGLEVVVNRNEARLRESSALAGSLLRLNQAVGNVVAWTGATMSEALNMASLNPARLLGLDDRLGSIHKEKLANLAILDQDFNVVETIMRGNSVWQKIKSA